ncbi:MAG: PLP-dependent aminotransferase family protein, partial [Rhizobiales bacterium]|nr:PLP-dependent aminotransferase family protein [Hyphomicrobiales bacterium]
MARTGAPIYVEIADAIARDIDSGRLIPGEKLPPQRNLAFDIKVTVGTISRAYSLARERGLVTGEVGRGTYVHSAVNPLVLAGEPLNNATPPDIAPQASDEPVGVHPEPGKLRLDSTSATEVGQSAIIARHMMKILSEYPTKTTDYIRALKPEWQHAGREWLTHGDWRPDLSGIVPTLGVHAGMMAVIAAMTVPGDKIAFEALTYASLARAVNLIGRRAIAVPMKDNMLDVEAFENVCANQHPKLLVTIPTLQNPTTSIMPPQVRRQLAQIAQRHNIWLIEDNIYGAKLAGTPAPIAAYAPERTFHLSGLSKSVAAGLRAGWVSCPQGYAARVPTAHKLLTGGMPFLLAEKGARIVLSGEAEEIAARVRKETKLRVAVAGTVFSGLEFDIHPSCPF